MKRQRCCKHDSNRPEPGAVGILPVAPACPPDTHCSSSLLRRLDSFVQGTMCSSEMPHHTQNFRQRTVCIRLRPPHHPLRRRQWKILAHISGTWSTGHLGLRCLEGRQHTAQHHRRLLRQVNTWVGRPTCRRPTSTCPADTWRIPTLPPHLSIPWHTCHTQRIPRLTPHTCSE